MAGHSKWANIKFRKAAQDKKRGKLFTKLIKEIAVAARIGGEIVDTNPRLRTAIDKALSQNMTRDTINRAIKRGAGGQDGADMVEIRYEGYGPAGVAVMVDCLTDNRNRTVADVRHAFTKAGGHLGTDGSVAYLFTKQGIISFAPGIGEEKVLEVVLALTVEDIHSYSDGSVDVITNPDHFIEVREALEKNNLQPAGAEVTMVAANEVNIEDVEAAEKIIQLQDMLEDLDDVQAVYMNAHIASQILSELN